MAMVGKTDDDKKRIMITIDYPDARFRHAIFADEINFEMESVVHPATSEEAFGQVVLTGITKMTARGHFTALPTKETTDWISVKDRLPEDGQNCIIHHNLYEPNENCGVYQAEFKHWHNDDELGFDVIDELNHGVTHWMPMPEPPKE